MSYPGQGKSESPKLYADISQGSENLNHYLLSLKVSPGGNLELEVETGIWAS